MIRKIEMDSVIGTEAETQISVTITDDEVCLREGATYKADARSFRLSMSEFDALVGEVARYHRAVDAASADVAVLPVERRA